MNRKPVLFDYLHHALYLTFYGVFKYIPSPIGDVFRKILLIVFGCRSAVNARLYEGVTIWYPYRVKIGRRVTLNEWVYLSGYGGLDIGDNVSIGHRTTVISSDHSCNKGDLIKNQPLKARKTVIGSDLFIGANCTILAGVTIGNGAVVGAGSVVVKDVTENAIVAGSPAAFIRFRD